MSKILRLTFLAYILVTLTACATVSTAATPQATIPPPTPAPTLPPTRPSSPTSQPLAAAPASFVCPVTPTVMDEPPTDPNSSPFGYTSYFINDDRTMWAGWTPESWTASPDGNKTVWIRPLGTDLQISGHRLDGDSAPVKADIPCCYPTGFQIVGLYFPTPGCWQVTATSGPSHLEFTLQVRNG